jgi:hypothetical protein
MRQPEKPVRSGKSNATPAPTQRSDAVQYGQNGFDGASSDTPGKRTTSALASAFDDPVLQTVRERGAKSNQNYANATPLPTTPSNKPSTPNPAKVPNGCGGCED